LFFLTCILHLATYLFNLHLASCTLQLFKLTTMKFCERSEQNEYFRNLNLLKIKKLLKSPVLLDLRNLYDPATIKSLGFIYEGVGRR